MNGQCVLPKTSLKYTWERSWTSADAISSTSSWCVQRPLDQHWHWKGCFQTSVDHWLRNASCSLAWRVANCCTGVSIVSKTLSERGEPSKIDSVFDIAHTPHTQNDMLSNSSSVNDIYQTELPVYGTVWCCLSTRHIVAGTTHSIDQRMRRPNTRHHDTVTSALA